MWSLKSPSVLQCFAISQKLRTTILIWDGRNRKGDTFFHSVESHAHLEAIFCETRRDRNPNDVCHWRKCLQRTKTRVCSPSLHTPYLLVLLYNLKLVQSGGTSSLRLLNCWTGRLAHLHNLQLAAHPPHQPPTHQMSHDYRNEEHLHTRRVRKEVWKFSTETTWGAIFTTTTQFLCLFASSSGKLVFYSSRIEMGDTYVSTSQAPRLRSTNTREDQKTLLARLLRDKVSKRVKIN